MHIQGEHRPQWAGKQTKLLFILDFSCHEDVWLTPWFMCAAADSCPSHFRDS